MSLIYPNETKLFVIAAVLAGLFWLLLIVGTLGVALVYIALLFLFGLFVQASFITYVKGSGVLVTAEQFPDIHAQLLACSAKVGVDEIPDTYLLRTDFFNALATRFLRRHYIVLFTNVVDALESRPDALNFYIGHELGHIHRKHIRWGWLLAPALLLPLLGAAYRRAEEYTCDRYGNACCERDEDATAALAAIVAGDTRWNSLNVPSYLKQTATTNEFWMSLNEFTSDYPWMSKRMAWIDALRKNTTPEFPRRHPLAAFLAAFVPNIPGGLISLILIVAIIGILAAIALPAYQEYVTNSELASARMQSAAAVTIEAEFGDQLTAQTLSGLLDELGDIRNEVDTYYLQNNAFPESLTNLRWESDVLNSELGGMPINLYSDGIIAVGFGDIGDQSLYFVNEPVVSDEGQLQWYCYGQNLPENLLPDSCS